MRWSRPIPTSFLHPRSAPAWPTTTVVPGRNDPGFTRSSDCVGENLNWGRLSDHRSDRHGRRLRSVRGIRGIDAKVSLNKDLWGLAERMVNGEGQPAASDPAVLTA